MYFYKADDTDESPASEAKEDDDEQVAEFANKFVLRGVQRLTEFGLVAVRVAYLSNRNKEYEYFIPYEDYTYDKVEIARQIRQQHRETSSSSGRKK